MSSRLARVQDWESLAQDSGYRVCKLAKLVGVTPRQLHRFFLRQYGASPRQWMRIRRQEAARRLLALGWSTKETAAQVSYADGSCLCRMIRRGRGEPSMFSENVRLGQ